MRAGREGEGQKQGKEREARKGGAIVVSYVQGGWKRVALVARCAVRPSLCLSPSPPIFASPVSLAILTPTHPMLLPSPPVWKTKKKDGDNGLVKRVQPSFMDRVG